MSIPKDQPRREELLKLLIDSFLEMFPNSNRSTRFELWSRLQLMEMKDLELLAKNTIEALTERGDPWK